MAEIKAKKVIFKNRDGEYLLPVTEEKTGLVLFDTILKDHILTYEESKGLALQGTYVYKEAIAGSRYGYPDFYNKCLEEFNNNSNTKQWIKSNITQVGALADNQGVLSGFAPSIYAKVDKVIDFNSADSWEINLKLKTGSNYTAFNDFFGVAGWGMALGISTARKFSLAIGTGGSNWSIGSPTGTHTVQDNTAYYVRVKFTGSAYTLEYSLNGIDYSTDITIQSSVKTISGIPNLGIYTNGSNLTGSIDLNESYININGKRAWNGAVTTVKNPNGHVFYDISIKDQIDEIFNSTGMAWFYGIDTENERIFLPRNNWFEQIGGIDEVGDSVEAGLPNITGGARVGGYKRDAIGGYTSGALSYSGTGGASDDFYGGSGNGFTHVDVALNAFNSSPIYGNSDTVQPNAVKKLLYICVGNTTNYEGMTDVVNQGMEILEQVNQGIESRANIDITNLSADGKSLIANYSMPDYEAMVTGQVSRGVWVQVAKDSFVVVHGGDPYTENYYIYVSPNQTTTYIVGHRYDDTNGQTEGTSFSFFVPKGWYFQGGMEGGAAYYIYPLKGAN